MLIPSLFLVGFFFAQLGVLVGVRAEQFDDVSFAQTFVLQPLIFLGGVFYSASLLPEPFQTLTHFNPVYYMINLVRYGFLGYTEANIALSLALLTLAPLPRCSRSTTACSRAATSCGPDLCTHLFDPRRALLRGCSRGGAVTTRKECRCRSDSCFSPWPYWRRRLRPPWPAATETTARSRSRSRSLRRPQMRASR